MSTEVDNPDKVDNGIFFSSQNGTHLPPITDFHRLKSGHVLAVFSHILIPSQELKPQQLACIYFYIKMESVPQTQTKSAFDIKTLINSENVERKFYETVTASSSSEDESNTDYEREELPRIIPTKQIAAPSSIDM